MSLNKHWNHQVRMMQSFTIIEKLSGYSKLKSIPDTSRNISNKPSRFSCDQEFNCFNVVTLGTNSRREILFKSKSDLNIYKQTTTKNSYGDAMINRDEAKRANTPGMLSLRSKMSAKHGFDSDSLNKSNKPSEGK